jgi:hypothetical protein
MEKNMLLVSEQLPEERLRHLMQTVSSKAKMPMEWLRRYYSAVLEREISLHQTFLLLQAQAAFVMAVFPVAGPLLLRAAFCGWFAYAVWQCRKAL